MPWSKDDYPLAMKSLPEGQRAKAIEIANAVLADCQKQGGKDCEGKAIRIGISKAKGAA